jgi:cytoskeletal protein RodZ
LRRAREDRRLTLTAVSDRTKIPRRVIEQLERNAFDELPTGPVTKGYLRAVADETGLDREWVLGCARPYLAAEIDVLDRLRVRVENADHCQHGDRTQQVLIQLLVVLVCLAGLFYALTVRDRAQTAALDTPNRVLFNRTVTS